MVEDLVIEIWRSIKRGGRAQMLKVRVEDLAWLKQKIFVRENIFDWSKYFGDFIINFHTNFYLLTGSVRNFIKKHLKHFLSCPALFHSSNALLSLLLKSTLLLKVPIFNKLSISFSFNNAPTFLYKYLHPCFNKSVLNWTYCQLLC